VLIRDLCGVWGRERAKTWSVIIWTETVGVEPGEAVAAICADIEEIAALAALVLRSVERTV
jgi:hypothetical protein